MATERGSAASHVALFLLLVVLALGAYVGLGLYLTPTVISISPAPAKPGETFIIQGTNFARDPWENVVLFGGQSGKVTKATPGTLEVEVPELSGLGAGPARVAVRVVVGGRVSRPFEMALAVPVAETTPEPSAPPPTVEPVPETPSPSPPAPRPTPHPTPTATPTGPRVADLLAEGATAESSRRYDEAAGLYEKAVLLEPQNAKAQAALKAAQAAAAVLKKSFTPGKTQAEGPPVARGDFKEFDTREVAIHKTADVPARLDFEITPAHLMAGDAYALKVYLKNEGTKSIRIASMRVTTTANGVVTVANAAPARPGDIPAKARSLVHEAQGVWKDGTTAWALEVQVSSSKGDNYRNQVVWK